jgi:hypothetical protein
MNDPVEAEIETKFQGQIEAQLGGMSNDHRHFPRRHIERNRKAASDRLVADYFSENLVSNDVQFRHR